MVEVYTENTRVRVSKRISSVSNATYGFVEFVARREKVVRPRYLHKQHNAPREIPGLQQLGLLAFALRPVSTIRKRAKMLVVPDGQNDENDSDLESDSGAQGGRKNIESGGREEDGEVERWEVVV